MRILHLITSLEPGGIERFVLTLIRNMPSDQFSIDVCCKGHERGQWASIAEALGAHVFLYPLSVLHIGFARNLKRLLVKGEYQILHNHLGVYSGFPVWLSHRVGVAVVTTFHSTDFPPHAPWARMIGLRSLRNIYGQLSIRYAVRESDMTVCVSKSVVNSITRTDVALASKCRVLYHGVSNPDLPDKEARTAARKILGVPEDSQVIVHVGRFAPQKDHMGVLDVFEAVSKTCPKSRLLLIGDGELRPMIEREVVKRHLGDKVVFTGYLDQPSSILPVCDVFLFPSLSEGFGIAALEANAAGLPVVGSRIPGLTEAIEDGTTGFLHEIGDIEGMARSIVKLLGNPELARRVGQAGRRRVQRYFSEETMIEHQKQLYYECLGIAPGATGEA